MIESTYIMDATERSFSVITSAPNQNREYFDGHIERLLPYFAARALNRIVSIANGDKPEPLQVDMWNSFGHYMDQSYKTQTRFDGASREEYSTLLLDEKYKFLEDIGIDTESHKIIRDDGADTINWIQDKLIDLYGKGVIYEDTESLSVCAKCDNIISVAAVKVTNCSRCKSTEVRIEKRKTLFMDMPGDRIGYISDKIDLPRKARFINGQFATLPGRVMIARQRDYGQPLGIAGYEEMVLDPKVGLALMPEMIADKYDINVITQVQGSTTAKNTTPYTALLSPNLQARYIFTSNIPNDIDTEKMNAIGVDFFTKYLPIFMLDRSSNVDENQLQSVAVEHSKAKRKLENAISYLSLYEGDVYQELPGDFSKIYSALGRIATYNVRSGVLELRRYIYEDLGSQYIDELRQGVRKLSLDELEKIESILREVF